MCYLSFTQLQALKEITKLFITVLEDWYFCWINSEADLQLLQREGTLKPRLFFLSNQRSLVYELPTSFFPRVLKMLKRF